MRLLMCADMCEEGELAIAAPLDQSLPCTLHVQLIMLSGQLQLLLLHHVLLITSKADSFKIPIARRL